MKLGARIRSLHAMALAAARNRHSVTDVLGRTRAIEKVWPDGSYSCPFCWAAVQADKKHCPNPACPANDYALTHPAERERFAKAHAEKIRQDEDRKKEETSRQEILAFREKYARDREAETNERFTKALAECRARGACERCAFKPGWQYCPIKFVKHRGVCPNK